MVVLGDLFFFGSCFEVVWCGVVVFVVMVVVVVFVVVFVVRLTCQPSSILSITVF